MNTTTKNIFKWSIIGGLFAVPFIPFIVSQSLLFPFISGKGFTFRILIEIIFALWFILAIAEPEYRSKFNFVAKFILIFVGVVFLADLFSKYPYKSLWSNYERMEGFVSIIHLVAYYFVLSSMLQTEIWWKRFWNTVLASSVIMSVYGLLQLAGKITINQGTVRIDATFGNATYLAIYMVFCMFISLILLFKEQRKIWKWTYGGVFILNSIVLYFTATRGAILGFVGGIIIVALIMVWKERKNRSVRKTAGWFLSAIVAFILIFIVFRNTSFVQKSPVLSRFATLSVSEIKTQGRYYVWPMALKGVTERPLLGWGQESFNYVFNKYYNPAMYQQEQWFDRTHDIFLDWLINAGILGLLSYLSLYAALLYALWNRSNFSTIEKSLITGLIAAYLFHNIFVFDNLISYILFFSILAWVSSRPTATETALKPARTFDAETVNYLFLPFTAILLVLSIYFVNIPAIQTSKNLILGISNQKDGVTKNLEYLKKAVSYNSFGRSEVLEQLTNVSIQVLSSQSTDTVKQEFLNLTDSQIKEQIKRTPEDARYLLLGGSFYNRIGQYDKAIPYLTDAVKYSPNKQTMYFELGSGYLGKGDYKKALDLFAQGYNLEKNNPDAQVIYALGGIYAGKPDIVKAMFEKIGQDKIISDDRVLQAYINIKDYNSAIAILSERLRKNPTDYKIELNLASVYATMGNKAKAIELLKDVEAKNPSLKEQLDPYIKQLSQ